MESRAVSFPSGASYGEIHSEHGRSWEYTEPGIWRSLGTGDGGGEDYDDTQIKADLATETQARIDGDAALDLRIDAVEDAIGDGGDFVDAPNDGKLYGRQSQNWQEVPGGGVSDWADIENKPTEFPPSSHVHTIANVTGLSDALDDKSDVGHKHEIADVTGLQDALDNAGGDSATYTLPVALRSGNAQLPLTLDGTKLVVMTRGGELELPLAA